MLHEGITGGERDQKYDGGGEKDEARRSEWSYRCHVGGHLLN
jgi:hypothetical protein